MKSGHNINWSGGTGLYGLGNTGAGGSGGGNDGTGGEGGSVSNQTTPPGPNNNVGGGRNGTGSTGWGCGTVNDGFFGGGGGKVELELYGESVLLELQELSLHLQMLHIFLTLI